MRVVDANVFLYHLLGHGPVDAADGVLADASDLIASERLEHEVARALAMHAAAGRITAGEATTAYEDFCTFSIRRSACASITEMALELALSAGHDLYDMLYLAVAMAEDATLVTADAELARAARRAAPWVRVELIGA